jgi:hypothetical protein
MPHCLAYNISAWTAWKRPFLCCSELFLSGSMTYSIVTFTAIGVDRTGNIIPLFLFMETCLFAEPLLSSGCSLFAYFAVAA